jgi:hypothetical protein
MSAPDIALRILVTFILIVFGILTLVMLWYFVKFVISLASVHWIALPIGIIVLGYYALTFIAAQPK